MRKNREKKYDEPRLLFKYEKDNIAESFNLSAETLKTHLRRRRRRAVRPTVSYADSPDARRHPLFVQDAVQRCGRTATLRAGDALYVPRFCYHHVRTAAGPSISINHFASTPWELVRFGLPRLLLELLHRAGLHRSGYCVCCPCKGALHDLANTPASRRCRARARARKVSVCSVAAILMAFRMLPRDSIFCTRSGQ